MSYPKNTKLPALKRIIDHINGSKKFANLKDYQNAQYEAFQEQKKKNGNWLVSDLITIGSPLTYASILLANNSIEFEKLKEYREISTSPPDLDNKKLSYSSKSTGNQKMIASAVFATTRWTNIYSSNKFLIFGDIISGPVAHLFGDSIQDIDINSDYNRKLFDHTKYWKNGFKMSSIDSIRGTLNLDELKSECNV